MKTIGRTNEGFRIVEMSEGEFEALERLAVICGEVPYSHYQLEPGTWDFGDMTHWAVAVAQFAASLNHIRDAKSILGRFEKFLTKGEAEKDGAAT